MEQPRTIRVLKRGYFFKEPMKKTVLAEFNKFVNPIFGNFDKQAMALDQAAETVANAFS